MKSVAIVGAGVMGRCMALNCLKAGMQVKIFERQAKSKLHNSSLVAAGMLSPYCEMEYASSTVATLGLRSLELWKEIHAQFNKEFFFEQKGSLVLAHPQDEAELERLKQVLASKNLNNTYQTLPLTQLNETSVDLASKFRSALYFPNEGQVDPHSFFKAFDQHFEVNYQSEVNSSELKSTYDYVIDCRGLEAKANNNRLRGVRGEVIRVKCSEVTLEQPIRLMHPRFPLYVVPRPDHIFIIGATSLEVEDYKSPTVHSTLSLLSALYSIDSRFSEANIISLESHCRPAYADNLPQIQISENVISINGLYRHGYLLAPALAELVGHHLNNSQIPSEFSHLIKEDSENNI